jgi:hypothetical protein
VIVAVGQSDVDKASAVSRESGSGELSDLPSCARDQPLLAPACYPRHVRRGEPRTGCGIPDTVIGLTAGDGLAVDVVGDPVAVCCSSGCSNELAASGVPGSGGRPPRPPPANELVGRPPRAAQASRNWLLASNKVSGRITKLLLMSVFGAAMAMLPFTIPEAVILLSGGRMS